MKQHQSIGRLISIIHRSAFSFFNKEASDSLGLSQGQFFILHFVNNNPGASQHEIQEYFGRDKGNVSLIIKELLEDKYITKETDKTDKRMFCVFPTKKAKNKEATIQKILQQWTELLLSDFSLGERTLFFEFLQRAITNINEHQ